MNTTYEPARSWDIGTRCWAINVLPKNICLHDNPDHINHETVAIAWAWVDNDYIKYLEKFHAPE